MDKDFDVGRDGVTYQDKPVEYCKQIYQEARSRNDELADINEENRLFYEGIDSELEARKTNTNVERSSIFVHQLKPAIDTRVADSETSLEDREFPVVGRSPIDSPPPEVRDAVRWVEQALNRQMRDCGYLTEVFHDHVLASEIYRTPAAIKIDWEDVYEKTPVVDVPSKEEVEQAILYGQLPPEPTVKWVNKYVGGRPRAQYIPPDQFLYQPHVSDFYRDSEYVIYADWVSWNKLFALAEEYDLNKKKIEEFRNEVQDSDEEGSSYSESHQDRLEAERGTPFEEGYRSGKVLLCEIYVCYYTETGEERVDQIFMIGNKEIIKRGPTPYKGIKFPFVPLVANRMPGTIEGMSSVDVGKTMQRLYNETFNMYLDIISYKLFPPLLREPGTVINGEPVWGLGRIWDVTNPDGLRPLIDTPPGPLPNLPDLMEAVAGKLRDTLNAHDIAQGFQSKQYEKATSTKLRAFGSSKRAMPVKKQHGMSVVRVAEMFLAMNQQYHKEKERFVVPIILDCPSLTNVSDPDTDKRDAMMLLGQAMELPFYQTPLGQMKLLNIWRSVVAMVRKVDVNQYAHTSEELSQEIQQQTAAQLAAMEKQNAAQEMAMADNERQRVSAEEQATLQAIAQQISEQANKQEKRE